MKSAILNEERSYSIYTPPGFDAKASPYGLVVAFDGEVYGDFSDSYVPTPTILDNLLAEGRIPPMVLILVDSQGQQTRNRDLTCSAPFADFLAKELVPVVRAHYNVSSDPSRAVVAGSSFGGLCAAYCGLTHSEVFRNILSQSGSYWFTPDWRKTLVTRYLSGTGWLIEQYADHPKLPLRFYMEVGKFESGALQVATNRHLRDILRLKGYPVVYSEYYGGHDYLCWRGSLADGLIALIGR
jgi:enterochelin esterase family protein